MKGRPKTSWVVIWRSGYVRDALVALALFSLYWCLSAHVTHSAAKSSGLLKSSEKITIGNLQDLGSQTTEAFNLDAHRASSTNTTDRTPVGDTDRRLGAILSSFVADAASMGLHWIYDVQKIKQLVGQGTPEFFEPPSCPYYKYDSGDLSPYGYEELLLLRSVATRGVVDGPGLQQDLYEGFKAYGGRLNRASAALVSAVESGCSYPHCGARNDEAHGLVKVAIVAARYAGSPELPAKMEEAVLAHQEHPMAVATAIDAARLLEHVILHGSVARAMEWGLQPGNLSDESRQLLEAVYSSRHTPHTAAVKKFGQTCHLPGSFEASMHGAMTSVWLTPALRRTIMAGGDSCSRSILIAALFGAQGGAQSIPEEWKLKVKRFAEIEGLARRVLGGR